MSAPRAGEWNKVGLNSSSAYRMRMRRMTGLTKGFSKRANLEAAYALWFPDRPSGLPLPRS